MWPKSHRRGSVGGKGHTGPLIQTFLHFPRTQLLLKTHHPPLSSQTLTGDDGIPPSPSSSTRECTSLMTESHPKTPSLNIMSLRVRISTYESGEDVDIHSIAMGKNHSTYYKKQKQFHIWLSLQNKMVICQNEVDDKGIESKVINSVKFILSFSKTFFSFFRHLGLLAML